jgi:hypothetical protein
MKTREATDLKSTAHSIVRIGDEEGSELKVDDSSDDEYGPISSMTCGTDQLLPVNSLATSSSCAG